MGGGAKALLNKKAFTLIELLAVIVILSIIALIATPLIMNIINDAKKGAFESSSYGIIKAAEQGYAKELIKNENIELTEYEYTNGEKTLKHGNIEINYKGSNPASGRLLINSEGEVALAFYNNGYCITKSYGDDKLTTKKVEKTSCVMPNYSERILNGADPEVKEGMIAVTIEKDGTVKKANIEDKWYSYKEKRWANVILVEADVRNTYNVGDIIQEDKILAYYVWIPRYKYEIFNDGSNIEVNTTSEPESNEQTIKMIFENKNTPKSLGNTTGEYLTHPAFTFGEEELNGIWVGKYETTGTSEKITILPNKTSLRNLNVSTMFTLSRDIEKENNIYGLVENQIDTHMMKNMEWGAVAYLSHSIYGINGNIRYNNSSTYTTGCAASNEPTTGYLTAGYAGCENVYTTEIGYLASTTGNITGIYDMAGSAWEYVMGIVKDSTNTKTPLSGRNSLYNSGFNGLLGCATCDSQDGSITKITNGINFPNSKYYDLYEYGTSIITYERGKLGDATKELANFGKSTIEMDSSTRYVSSWYHDQSNFFPASNPWVIRGGDNLRGKDAGVFVFSNALGNDNSYTTFRQVIAIK